MDSSPYSQFTTSRDFLYSYLHLIPSNGRDYIIFLHGFPSYSYDWRHQIQYFSKKGYGIIAPDLLGYGASSKPLEIQAYKGKAMAKDIAEILKHEKIDKVIGVAHDWGSFLLSRLANFYPALLSKLVFLDIGYTAPGFGLTKEAVTFVNSQVQKTLGYSCFGYFLFFAEEDAATLLNKNSESIQSLIYSKDEELGKRYMGAVGGTREWVTSGRVAPREPYFTSEDALHYQKMFDPEHGGGGYAAPIRWYIAQLENINESDEKEIPEANRIIQQPTLLINSSNFITKTADFPSQMKPLVPNLKNEFTNCGHWIQLEQPDAVNKMLQEFF